jgi:S1-C subfamily serine protease
VNRLASVVLTAGLMAISLSSAVLVTDATAAPPLSEPTFTPLDLHPVDALFSAGAKPVVNVMPKIVRQGIAAMPDPRQIAVPGVATPDQPPIEDPAAAIGKAGTGFFVGDDGTMLTAAHVVKECHRMQVISKYMSRTWVSLVAQDEANDIAILKAMDRRPPAIVRIAAGPPVSDKLFVLGFPESAGLLVAAEAWGTVENQKFPATIGALANPRELLWMAAPAVTPGYSGAPIFDPKLGAVVGLVKGEVDGGYLRLVRDMPTTGIAIGPGIAHIVALMHHDAPYAAVSLVSSPGEAGEDTLRRATVHVLCWH